MPARLLAPKKVSRPLLSAAHLHLRLNHVIAKARDQTLPVGSC
jgi:hypothetical protein